MKENFSRNEFLFPHTQKNLDSYSKYLDQNSLDDLKKSILKLYDLKHNITLTHGSEDSLIKLLLYFRKFTNKLVVSDISWEYYKVLGHKTDYELSIIPSVNNSLLDPNFDFVDDISIKNHVIIIGNPCNPSGKYLEKHIMIKIINSGAKIIMDCTYQSPLEFDKTLNLYYNYKNIVFITSLSKHFGVPGLRLGFFISNNERLHYSLDLYLGVNATYHNIVKSLLNNKNYYMKVKEQRKNIIDSILKKKFNNFEIHSNIDYYILVIFKHYLDQSIVNYITNINNCKVKFLIKNNYTLLRINISSNNQVKIINILNYLDSFIDFIKNNKFHLLRHEKREESLSFNTLLTQDGLIKSNNIEICNGNVFCSSYPRCIQTILPYAKKNSLIINLDHNLDEFECIEDKIYFENDTIELREEILLKYKKYTFRDQNQIKQKKIFNDLFDTIESKKNDLVEFLSNLLKNKSDKNIIICSHQTTLALLIKIINFDARSIADIENTIKMGSIIMI